MSRSSFIVRVQLNCKKKRKKIEMKNVEIKIQFQFQVSLNFVQICCHLTSEEKNFKAVCTLNFNQV